MDFQSVLLCAKKNNDAVAPNDGQGKFYSTKYAPPKKENKKSKQLSINVQKFLKKREAEETESKREKRQMSNDLMAKRDKKVQFPDAGADNYDDYGYVSNEANAFYQKYIEKVKDVQENKRFSPSRPQSLGDLSGTKERVKAALTSEREGAKTHSKPKVTGAGSNVSTKTSSVAKAGSPSKPLYDPEAERREEEQKKHEEEQQRKLKRAAQPPPMDFQTLIRLAEQKQHEPVVFEQPLKKKEPERLLTAREKREQEERLKQREMRKQRDLQTSQGMLSNGRIPKLSLVKAATATKSSSKLSQASSTKPNPSSTSRTVKSRNPYADTVGKTTREFPPRNRPRQFSSSDILERNNKRRLNDEDDSEYDSELEDFIDESDGKEDISSHIREIFGYDKRRYEGMDDDDRTMESSYAQVQREEFISKKLGLQEDLEDMRMEALQKKRKIAKKPKTK